MSARRLVIVGDGESAEIAYEYFTRDSPHEVAAFSVEREYMRKESLFGLPVVPLEEMARRYPPSEYAAFVAISSTQLNRLRKRLYLRVKGLGYELLSYVSSRAFVWHNVEIGENSFVFENNVLQHRVRIGNNVVLWSGNHVGHQTVIEDHVFVSSHAVISGFCRIGESSFLGVNCCFADRVTVGTECVIGMGAVVVRDAEAGRTYVGSPAKPTTKTALETFGVKAES